MKHVWDDTEELLVEKYLTADDPVVKRRVLNRLIPKIQRLIATVKTMKYPYSYVDAHTYHDIETDILTEIILHVLPGSQKNGKSGRKYSLLYRAIINQMANIYVQGYVHTSKGGKAERLHNGKSIPVSELLKDYDSKEAVAAFDSMISEGVEQEYHESDTPKIDSIISELRIKAANAANERQQKIADESLGVAIDLKRFVLHLSTDDLTLNDVVLWLTHRNHRWRAINNVWQDVAGRKVYVNKNKPWT